MPRTRVINENYQFLHFRTSLHVFVKFCILYRVYILNSFSFFWPTIYIPLKGIYKTSFRTMCFPRFYRKIWERRIKVYSKINNKFWAFLLPNSWNKSNYEKNGRYINSKLTFLSAMKIKNHKVSFLFVC